MSYREPSIKRVVIFFDCQNLFNACKNLWEYSFPNFDPIKLSNMVIKNHQNDGWLLHGMRLYTGI